MTAAQGDAARTPLHFGAYRLERDDASLWRSGARVPLTPKAFGLLSLLAENAGRLVTRERILERVWSGTAVSEAVVKVCIAQLRRVFEDSAERPTYIRTEPGFGYRFIAEVREGPCEPARAVAPSGGAPERAARTDLSDLDPAHVLEQQLHRAEHAAQANEHGICAEQLAAALATARLRFAAEPSLACELALRLGEAQTRAGAVARAHSSLLGSVELARATRDPRLFADAVLGLGDAWSSLAGADPALRRLLEEALALGAQLDPARLARLQARLAYALCLDRADAQRAELLAAAALDATQQSSDSKERALILRDVLWASWGPDRLPWRRALAAELVQVSTRLSDVDTLLHAYDMSIGFALEAADIAFAEQTLIVYERLARETRRPWFEWLTSRLQVADAARRGELERADRLIDEWLERARSFDHPDALLSFLAQRTSLRLVQGRAQETTPLLRELCARAGAGGHPLWNATLAFACALSGERAEAATQLEAAAAAPIPRDRFWKATWTTLADACAIVGSRALAARIYAELHPYAQECAPVHGATWLGSIERPLALMACLDERPADALRHFEAALQLHRRCGAAPLEMVASVQCALFLAEPLGPERSGALFEAGRALAARMGSEEGYAQYAATFAAARR
jgi:DNA-binding winged helix-turn-helix (wHTH) protein